MGISIVATNLLRIVLFFIAVYYIKSLSALLFSLVVIYALQFCLYNIILLKDVPFYNIKFQKQIIRLILNASWPLLLTGIFGYGMLYFDGILIAALMPIKEFSIYRNGAIEIPFLSTIYVSVSSVILPDMSRLAKENKIDELLALKRKASLNIATLIFPVIFYFIINGEFLIKTYLSEKYVESAIVFSLYNITTLVRITDYQDIFTITGKANKLLLYYLGGFITNILLNIWLITTFGILGAVLAYGISIFLLLIGITVGSSKLIRKPISQFFNFYELGKITLICLISSSALYYIHSITTNLFYFAILSIVYFLTVYKLLFKFNVMDKKYFESMLLKIPFGSVLKKIIT